MMEEMEETKNSEDVEVTLNETDQDPGAETGTEVGAEIDQ